MDPVGSIMKPMDWWIETSRKWITRAYCDDYNLYQGLKKGSEVGFDELLCWEIYENRQTLNTLAKKWNISLSCLGELIADHCRKLEG